MHELLKDNDNAMNAVSAQTPEELMMKNGTFNAYQWTNNNSRRLIDCVVYKNLVFCCIFSTYPYTLHIKRHVLINGQYSDHYHMVEEQSVINNIRYRRPPRYNREIAS